ncbi:MAG: 3-oxoadipyl-CoA thiolase [Pseudomonadota bacterium]|nr:3-oxoadipyl-CoA thiolase [Pseudomonadota bacterium]
MNEALICDAVRTPFGRYGGALSTVRPDDLGALVLREILRRNPRLEASAIGDVIMGCANQAGEDNRNVARMSALLAGLPVEVAGVTLNRLCGSGLDAVAGAARMILAGEADVVLAGGVESMSRAPYVLSKSAAPFARDLQMFDTTMGWRFVNPLMQKEYGTDSMPETAENVAADFKISREDQDRFALRSQQRALAARAAGLFAHEIVAVPVGAKRGAVTIFNADEHPRETSLEALSKLPALFRTGGTITAGNSSGVNDGACALIIASPEAVRRYGLKARARVLGTAVAGVAPRIMGIGPTVATRKLLERLHMTLADIDLIELNEAFASQSLAVLRDLGLADDAAHVNPQGGAIALGHPLGASGARLVTTAVNQLERNGGRKALCTMCIGVGQGIAMVIERVT